MSKRIGSAWLCYRNQEAGYIHQSSWRLIAHRPAGMGLLPILDLKVWVKRRMTEGGGGGGVCVLLHKFYSKNVASKSVICARQAILWSSERTIFTQQVLRIWLNCSRELPWTTVVGNVNHKIMMLCHQYSGYNQGFRMQVIQSVMTIWLS